MKQIPVKLEADNIVEVVTEIRYQADHKFVDFKTIFGSVMLKKGFTTQETPFCSLPDEVVATDPNLSKIPFVFYSKDNQIVNLSPFFMSFHRKETYGCWADYKTEIMPIISEIINQGAIKDINQLSLRYVDFFENVDIFSDIEVDMSFSDANIAHKKVASRMYRFSFLNKTEEITTNIMLVNDAVFKTVDNKDKKGSIADMTTFTKENVSIEVSVGSLSDKLEEVHSESKQVFFGLLKRETIEAMKPIYQS